LSSVYQSSFPLVIAVGVWSCLMNRLVPQLDTGNRNVMDVNTICLTKQRCYLRMLQWLFRSMCTYPYSLSRKYSLVVCFLLGNSPASEFYMPMFQNTLSVPSS
jgi:hypothetical protein